ncbi:MAG: hypothetical protein PHQ89_01705 [Bacilli bacterium]|nr:hypothetical protein [Bacilli bacterium]
MTRDEARVKVVDILLGENNQNKDFYANTFENHNYGDPEMTPISPLYMDSANKEHNVVITEEAFNNLLKIKQITEQTNNEVAFFLFGEEKPNGTIWFDTVISDFKPSSVTTADFDSITPKLNQYVDMIKSGQLGNENKQVVCHGHTHGISPVSDNFSFGDLISYVRLTNADLWFQNRKIETMGMLMPPSGDFNFIMYENNPNYEGFYTFQKVYLRHNDSTAELLPSYINGNYIEKNSMQI